MTYNELKAMALRIKNRRLSLKYTQEQFAEMIGISASSYTKIENAFQQPSLDTLIMISKKLNISVDYILFGTGNENQNHIDNNDIFNGILEYAEKDKLLHASTVLKKLANIIDNEI